MLINFILFFYIYHIIESFIFLLHDCYQMDIKGMHQGTKHIGVIT